MTRVTRDTITVLMEMARHASKKAEIIASHPYANTGDCQFERGYRTVQHFIDRYPNVNTKDYCHLAMFTGMAVAYWAAAHTVAIQSGQGISGADKLCGAEPPLYKV